MEDTKEFELYEAQVCGYAGRYEDMVEVMKDFVTSSETDLTDNERKMLWIAYKNVIDKIRFAWRGILLAYQEFEETHPSKLFIQEYYMEVKSELNAKCKEVLDLLEVSLIPKAVDADSKVFFLKMKADFLRYEVEVSPEEDELKRKCKQAYLEATEISEENLPPAHPFRLGLALHFSVFMYEIEGAKSEGYEMAKKACVEAEPELKNLHGSELKEISMMLKVFQDNLTLWGGESVDSQERRTQPGEVQ